MSSEEAAIEENVIDTQPEPTKAASEKPDGPSQPKSSSLTVPKDADRKWSTASRVAQENQVTCCESCLCCVECTRSCGPFVACWLAFCPV
ncbi:unnamed protein product [Bursaphelenchus xylophilus]|uniref:(pine wood nematode) hypothetical protein n=1 Tax=Bursaphelenchus xylophilus TaxID=6326 RepID=A0A1I7RXL5_BURXY|nr:unnamed protein product [Bursaphelenchus xylophilus]CAG9126556.1 unnamed protein product [Bursaphelenchus xylophilus]